MTMRLYCLMVVLICVGIGGCQPVVRHYDIPSHRVHVNRAIGHPSAGPDYPAYKRLVWGFYWPDMPEWKRETTTDTWTRVRLVRGDMVLTVTQLSGNSGTVGTNVNRWRRQLGLPPVKTAKMVSKTYGNSQYDTLVLSAGDSHMMVAQQSVQSEQWFIKLTGSDLTAMAAVWPSFLAELQLGVEQ
ncbi:MAG: hypothetical protein P8L47_03140 [Candidatus Marinamargulisbacteria bacterium]|nr:hypothetical protein [Candidatus Marinamargulisbacteria bacterium]